MDKLKIKKELIDKCFEMQQKNAMTVETAMKDAQHSANDYGSPEDRYDSFRGQMLTKRDMYAKKLHKALNDIKALNRISVDKENNSVEFGSVVVTDKQKMFIAIAVGKVRINGDSYFAISPNVPVFKAMNGLKKGDKFHINGNEFTIEDIF